MRISDWSSDVCSSDLVDLPGDRSPHGYVASARQRAKTEIIVEEIAAIVEHAIDARTKAAGRGTAHIDGGAIARKIPADPVELIKREASDVRHTGRERGREREGTYRKLTVIAVT